MKWKTIQTENFSIHTHLENEFHHKRIAAIAENALKNIENELRWKIKSKIQLVIYDDVDIANGWATVFPTNTTTIFIQAPPGDGALADYDDWVRLVLVHEMTHLVHLDMASGLPKFLRIILGRSPLGFLNPLFPTVFPNVNQPAWLIEGYATYLETELTSRGRGRSSYFDMLLRAPALEGKLSTLGQLTDWQTTWPGGTIRYLYGYYLYDWMAKRIHPDTPTKIATANAHALYPQFHINSGPHSFGWTYRRIYDLWKRDIIKKYDEQRSRIEKEETTQSRPLTRRGNRIQNPTFSPDGKKITYTDHNPHETPSVKIMEKDGSNDMVLFNGLPQSRPSWASDGSFFIISLLDYYKTHSFYGDLYQYDFLNKKLKRITKGLRALNPSLSPDNQKIVFVKHRPFTQDLMIFNLGNKNIEPLVIGKNKRQFGQPEWSPDGEKIVYSSWREGGYWDIEVLNIQEKNAVAITNDRAVDISPTWSPDGKSILFSSDRSGVFNIYRYDLSQKKLYQVTHVLTGAFSPDVSDNGHDLVFTQYSSNGFNIHLTSASKITKTLAKPFVDPYPPIPPDEPSVQFEKESSFYNPFPTLIPRFWIPNFRGGISTLGIDALWEHFYTVGTYAGPDFDFRYINQSFYPYLQFYYWDFRKTGYDSELPGWVGDGFSSEGHRISTLFPFRRFLFNHAFQLGYVNSSIDVNKAQRENKRISNNPLQGLEGYDVEWSFSNVKVYGFSIAPEDGRRLSINYFEQGHLSGEKPTVSVVGGSWREYISGFRRHHVLMVGFEWNKSNSNQLDSFRSSLHPAQFLFHELRNQFMNALSYDVVPPLEKSDDGFFDRSTELQAAYAFPIATIEKAPWTGFYFLDRIHGKFFYSYDHFTQDMLSRSLDRQFIGTELLSEWGLSFTLPLTVGVNVQRDISSEKDWHFSLRIGINGNF